MVDFMHSRTYCWFNYFIYTPGGGDVESRDVVCRVGGMKLCMSRYCVLLAFPVSPLYLVSKSSFVLALNSSFEVL